VSDDPYSILGVSRDATDAEVERAYDRRLHLFDPESYPGSTQDAYRRLDELNAAYAQIRGEGGDEAAVPEDPQEPIHAPEGRHAAIADMLVRLGFVSSDVRRGSNPAVDVLATLLPEDAEVAVCLTCLGVKANGPYECRETSGTFTAMTITRQDGPYAIGDYVHAIDRTDIVLCTQDEVSWTASQYAGHGNDRVTLYSIPFTEILGAEVRGRKHDVAEVWIDDGPTVSIHTRPHEADGLCEYVERVAST
jgi:DnaJ domain